MTTTILAPHSSRASGRMPRPTAPTAMRNVVFLSASSGGGHDGTARAFAAWMERAGIGTSAEIVDVYGGGLRALPWMSGIRRHSNTAWRTFAAIMERPAVMSVARALLRPIVVRRCVRAISRRPDLIVATHFVPAQFMREIAEHFDPAPSTLTIASDYEPHGAWFGNADLTIVSDPLGVECARARGVPAERLFPVPLLPARPAPAPEPQRNPRRGRELRVCAVMGADGTSAGRLFAVLRDLERRAPGGARIRIEVICGRNERLRARLVAVACRFRRVAVTAAGFVADVPGRLADADVALIRGSPLVLTEALAAGVPVLAFDWHAHEAAVAELLERWNCGYASRRPGQIASQMIRWMDHAGEMTAVRHGARSVLRGRFDESAVRAVLAALNVVARGERRAA